MITGIAAAGAWVLISRKLGRRRVLDPTGLVLLLLAGYQFAEVAVCRSPERKIWTQLAYVDITWLPPLGLWLAYQLGAPRLKGLRTAALIDAVLAAGFSVWILAAPAVMTRSVCQMVLARYFPTQAFDISYALY